MGAGVNTGGGGGRRRRGRTAHRPMAEINVTPFVDVMLVLLIIFMVSAPLMTNGVPLDLPAAKGNQLQSQDKEPLVVSITKDGRVFLGQEENTAMRLEDLVPKLKAVAQNRGGSEEPIFVRGDKSVEYGQVARVMARIRDAGFRKLSLVTVSEGG